MAGNILGGRDQISPLILGFLDCLCPRVATHFKKDVGYVIPYGVDADIELLAYFEVDVPFGDQLKISISLWLKGTPFTSFSAEPAN